MRRRAASGQAWITPARLCRGRRIGLPRRAAGRQSGNRPAGFVRPGAVLRIRRAPGRRAARIPPARRARRPPAPSQFPAPGAPAEPPRREPTGGQPRSGSPLRGRPLGARPRSACPSGGAAQHPRAAAAFSRLRPVPGRPHTAAYRTRPSARLPPAGAARRGSPGSRGAPLPDAAGRGPTRRTGGLAEKARRPRRHAHLGTVFQNSGPALRASQGGAGGGAKAAGLPDPRPRAGMPARPRVSGGFSGRRSCAVRLPGGAGMHAAVPVHSPRAAACGPAPPARRTQGKPGPRRRRPGVGGPVDGREAAPAARTASGRTGAVPGGRI